MCQNSTLIHRFGQFRPTGRDVQRSNQTPLGRIWFGWRIPQIHEPFHRCRAQRLPARCVKEPDRNKHISTHRVGVTESAIKPQLPQGRTNRPFSDLISTFTGNSWIPHRLKFSNVLKMMKCTLRWFKRWQICLLQVASTKWALNDSWVPAGKSNSYQCSRARFHKCFS